ncbi:MAG TPA: AzlD domain-containing protein [Candidatus Atopostipes pullistercoris]|uniref:AzlD domain-containing protein n=1 Tax=Candidatus Atopostipes pullistercoris TaxID=2838467 RepID=A0A9D2G2W9_9LACT|nr:AzlD domain-containing protein [Candidatus Atopostipes pullistercoris]
MTHKQMLLTVFVIMLGTMFTRFLVFFIFPPSKEPPQFVNYLGKVLPAAAIGLLVIYALKEVKLTKAPFAIPEFLAILVIVLIHKWRRNSLLSIATGTIVYMVLIQGVF